MRIQPSSSTLYLLKALIPYTDQNIKLSYKPSLFFNELERLHGKKKIIFRNAFSRAIKRGLVYDDCGIPRLTEAGVRLLAPYVSKKLPGAQLMVVFDIPETHKWQRGVFRSVLKEFRFHLVQKSVWVSDLDCREYITAEIKNLKAEDKIKIYEVRQLN